MGRERRKSFWSFIKVMRKCFWQCFENYRIPNHVGGFFLAKQTYNFRENLGPKQHPYFFLISFRIVLSLITHTFSKYSLFQIFYLITEGRFLETWVYNGLPWIFKKEVKKPTTIILLNTYLCLFLKYELFYSSATNW